MKLEKSEKKIMTGSYGSVTSTNSESLKGTNNYENLNKPHNFGNSIISEGDSTFEETYDSLMNDAKKKENGSSSGGTGKDIKEPWTLRRIALDLSLYVNLGILLIKVVAYARTLSLSVLAALVDSVLDVVSQIVLNYTEKHSSLSRSSALYPAGASRLEPVGVLTCAALMGMASFEILKESLENLFLHRDSIADADSNQNMGSFWRKKK